MKLLFVAVSLLVNAALVTAFALRPSRVPPAFRDYFTFGSGSANASSAGAAQRVATPSGRAKSDHPKLWFALETDDLAALVARLRAAGFPIYTIRAIVQSAASSRFDARMRELLQTDSSAPFWKSTQSAGSDPKRIAELLQLSGERSKLLRNLLGDFALRDDGDLTTAQRRQYGNLPRSKADQIDRINQDYSELTTQVRAAMNGITLPEDREKLALLEREKRADLVALLTPDELADYDMRNSPITARLRPALALFSTTEDEFRTIYKIEQAFSAQTDLTSTMTMTMEERMNFSQQRAAAQKAMDAQLQAALGDQRYAEFARSSDRDYQQLTQLEQRQNLPAGTAAQAYDLRNNLSSESNRIFNDTSLDYDQKRAALQSLAQNTRTQLVATLGPAGDAYVKSASWLAAVERGGAVTFSGTSTSFRSLPNPDGPRPGGSGGGVISSGSGTLFIAPGGGTVVTPANTSVIITSDGNSSRIIQTPRARSHQITRVPMKLSTLLLAGSFAANAALAALFIGGWSGGTTPPAATRTDSRPAAKATAAGDANAAIDPATWANLTPEDPATMLARLRAAGFPPAMIRALIAEQVRVQFAPQRAALNLKAKERPY